MDLIGSLIKVSAEEREAWRANPRYLAFEEAQLLVAAMQCLSSIKKKELIAAFKALQFEKEGSSRLVALEEAKDAVSKAGLSFNTESQALALLDQLSGGTPLALLVEGQELVGPDPFVSRFGNGPDDYSARWPTPHLPAHDDYSEESFPRWRS